MISGLLDHMWDHSGGYWSTLLYKVRCGHVSAHGLMAHVLTVAHSVLCLLAMLCTFCVTLEDSILHAHWCGHGWQNIWWPPMVFGVSTCTSSADRKTILPRCFNCMYSRAATINCPETGMGQKEFGNPRKVAKITSINLSVLHIG